jgi:hypothetical protein
MPEAMRSFLVAFASLVAATSVASAEPALTAVQPTPEAPSSLYVAGGAEAGGNDQYLTAGGLVEVGVRVGHGIWIHGTAADGSADRMFASVSSGEYLQLRAGADLMRCAEHGKRCMFLGADFGVQHTQWTGVDDGFSDSQDDMPSTFNRTKLIAVGRFGADIGNSYSRLRWRPGVEVSMSNGGFNGLNFIQSVALRF